MTTHHLEVCRKQKSSTNSNVRVWVRAPLQANPVELFVFPTNKGW